MSDQWTRQAEILVAEVDHAQDCQCGSADVTSMDRARAVLAALTDAGLLVTQRHRAVVDAARLLAEVEAVRSEQTEQSSIWLHGHSTASKAVADAVDALDAPAILKAIRSTTTSAAPATTDGAS